MGVQGPLAKLAITQNADIADYWLPLGSHFVALNTLIGQKLTLEFTGEIHCQACGRGIRKSYQQGYCFLATKRLAECDICIVKPELCHHHLGTCREPKWGLQHCHQRHFVYLANASGLKVGITRQQNIPTRWLDQGATQAIALYEVTSRRLAGLIEVEMKKTLSDTTNWRLMLKGESAGINLEEARQNLVADQVEFVGKLQEKFGENSLQVAKTSPWKIAYPVLQYPTKVSSLSFDKTPQISGTLLGIKGQYLILDQGVLNIRKFTSYVVALSTASELNYRPRLLHYPYAEQPPCQA